DGLHFLLQVSSRAVAEAFAMAFDHAQHLSFQDAHEASDELAQSAPSPESSTSAPAGKLRRNHTSKDNQLDEPGPSSGAESTTSPFHQRVIPPQEAQRFFSKRPKDQ